MLEKFLEQDISTNPIFNISRSRNFLSKIYQPIPFSIYLARLVSWGRYISTNPIFDLSCTRNFSREIYQQIPFSIYLAQEISWARYINQSHFWYILLGKFLEQDIPTNPIFDISRWSNFLSKIYQPIPFLIYLAREISWAKDISTYPIFDISCLRYFSSKIYQPITFTIYLALVIYRAKFINRSHFRYILHQKFLDGDISTNPIFDISCSRNFSSKIYQPIPFCEIYRKCDWLVYLAEAIK